MNTRVRGDAGFADFFLGGMGSWGLGGGGLNPLARFFRVGPAAPPPADAPTTTSLLEKGVVRLVVGGDKEGHSTSGNENDGDGSGEGRDCGDDGDVLLMWQVEGDIAFSLIVEEATDNLALAETCMSTIRLCLREILRPLGAAAAVPPLPKTGSASLAPPASHSSPPSSSSSSSSSLLRKAALFPPKTEPSDSGGGGGDDAAAATRGDALTAREVLSNPALVMAVVHHVMPGGKLMFVGVDAARTISVNLRHRLHVVAAR